MKGMKRSKYSEEQIAQALKQAEEGTPITDLCRRLGVSESTFHRWRGRYTGLGAAGLRELRELREENFKLKRQVADLTLDKRLMAELIGKKKLRY
jgi:putative transposase